ncbi:MAG: hypothetical protein FWG22_05750 [Prolixibacteraceae bacterium]|nr:hypothetical protein [Prolixibacteraceae bacterium]
MKKLIENSFKRKQKGAIVILCFMFCLFAFCRCTNDQTPEKEFLGKEYETIQYDESTTISCGTTSCFPEVSDKYVHPPMLYEEVPLFLNDPYNERFQVPIDVLKSLSTPGLIDALIQLPYVVLFDFLPSNPLAAVRWHDRYEFFTCAGELFQREDAGKALVAYYQLVKLDCLLSLPSETFEERMEIDGGFQKLLMLECLFTKQEILNTMNHDMKKEAVAVFLENLKKDKGFDRIYPMAHIMLAAQYEPIVKYMQENDSDYLHIFWSSGCPSDSNLCAKIVAFAKDFINTRLS